MTICVSVKVSEGLVLAADSSSAIQGVMQGPAGGAQRGILKTYDHVRKLSQIKDYPIGVLTWGAGLIGARTVESLIREFEHGLGSLAEESEKLREARIRSNVDLGQQPGYSVRDIAAGLRSHLVDRYDHIFDGLEEKPHLGLLVSGYSSEQFFPEQWQIDLPLPGELRELRPSVDGQPSFGANWFGLSEAITRLHHGRDDQVLRIVSDHFAVGRDEVHDLIAPLEYRVFFDGMPLQDAIDYAVYLVNVVIGRFRFVIGAPLCGGEIDVAVITPKAFTWVQRKSWVGQSPR